MGERVSAASVAQDTGHADHHRSDQNDEPKDDDHDALLDFGVTGLHIKGKPLGPTRLDRSPCASSLMVFNIEWSAQLHTQRGEPYVNHGAHWIHLRWGKVASFHAYLDTQRIARSCEEMAAAGVEEATAPPIIDSVSHDVLLIKENQAEADAGIGP